MDLLQSRLCYGSLLGALGQRCSFVGPMPSSGTNMLYHVSCSLFTHVKWLNRECILRGYANLLAYAIRHCLAQSYTFHAYSCILMPR